MEVLSHPRFIQQMVKQGISRVESRDFADAIPILQEAIELSSSFDLMVYGALAISYTELKQYEKAKALIEEALDQVTDEIQFRELMIFYIKLLEDNNEYLEALALAYDVRNDYNGYFPKGLLQRLENHVFVSNSNTSEKDKSSNYIRENVEFSTAEEEFHFLVHVEHFSSSDFQRLVQMLHESYSEAFDSAIAYFLSDDDKDSYKPSFIYNLARCNVDAEFPFTFRKKLYTYTQDYFLEKAKYYDSSLRLIYLQVNDIVLQQLAVAIFQTYLLSMYPESPKYPNHMVILATLLLTYQYFNQEIPEELEKLKEKETFTIAKIMQEIEKHMNIKFEIR